MLKQCLNIKALGEGYCMHVFLVKVNIVNSRATCAVPGVSPGRGLLIPHGYLNPGESEHSEVQSPSVIAGASLCFMGGPPTDLKNMADRQ